MDDISINLKLEIAIVALKTVRLNTKSKCPPDDRGRSQRPAQAA